MKRDIVCYKCGDKIFKGSGWKTTCDGTYYKSLAGERIKMVLGSSKVKCECDLCGQVIITSEECYARSVFKDTNEYYQWESDYIGKVESFQDLLSSI